MSMGRLAQHMASLTNCICSRSVSFRSNLLNFLLWPRVSFYLIQPLFTARIARAHFCEEFYQRFHVHDRHLLKTNLPVFLRRRKNASFFTYSKLLDIHVFNDVASDSIPSYSISNL